MRLSYILKQEYGEISWYPRRDPINELVYTILSQHTSDINSERAFDQLITHFITIEAISNADVLEIEECIKTAGLHKIKAVRIKEVLNIINNMTGGFDLSFLAEMPLQTAKNWLKSLPGIGPKTAAIVLCFSFGMPAMPVDTHIYRVSRRLGLIDLKTSVDKAHDLMEKIVAPDEIFPFHMYLIKHGRKICKALKPRCNDCIVASKCPSRLKPS
ncbi:MAG: endonuclease-3 [Chloroflexi bacterium]|nr:MAG: endonuclease-3 [Chloroflexota bacterium]